MVNVFKYAMKRRIPPRAGTAGNPPMQQLLHPFKVVILFALPHFSNHYPKPKNHKLFPRSIPCKSHLTTDIARANKGNISYLARKLTFCTSRDVGGRDVSSFFINLKESKEAT
eukprot:scaffold7337_cov66-Skeletonema_dohrnii-CCMP3373.AAC.2